MLPSGVCTYLRTTASQSSRFWNPRARRLAWTPSSLATSTYTWRVGATEVNGSSLRGSAPCRIAYPWPSLKPQAPLGVAECKTLPSTALLSRPPSHADGPCSSIGT
eukprot:5066769-Heterocapsa_arctica.AAC.1